MPIRSFGDHLASRLAAEGRVFYASDADQNDLVTGQTSFANTTPTFLLRNPTGSGVVLVPLYFALVQTGTVAGGAVDIITEIDDADRYSSGGTFETHVSARPKNGITLPSNVGVYSNPTASSGYGVRVAGITTGQDVSPAEGALQEYLWTPTSVMDLLDPASSLLVFTYAGTTGPSLWWSFKFGVIPQTNIASYLGW